MRVTCNWKYDWNKSWNIENNILQTHIMMETSQNCQPLVENNNWTPDSALILNPYSVLFNKTRQKPVVA